MPPKQITLKRRSEQIMVHTTEEIKERLQTIADARGWSLSLLGHEILKAWLEVEYSITSEGDSSPENGKAK